MSKDSEMGRQQDTKQSKRRQDEQGDSYRKAEKRINGQIFTK